MPTGKLDFVAKGEAVTDFLTNRTGFVVLHPIAGVAGAPARIETVGRRVLRHALSRADRPRPADDGPARRRPTPSRPARASNAAWRATPSRWRISATGPTPPTRPMCGRSLCPGPTRWRRARRSSRRCRLTVTARPRRGPGATARCVVRSARRLGTVPALGPGPRSRRQRRRSLREAAACCEQLEPQHLICHHDPRHGHDAATLARGNATAARALGADPVARGGDRRGRRASTRKLRRWGGLRRDLGHAVSGGAGVARARSQMRRCREAPWPPCPPARELFRSRPPAFSAGPARRRHVQLSSPS